MGVPEETIASYLGELLVDARKVVTHFEEAAQHLRMAEPQSACNAVAVARDAIDHVRSGRAEILQRFKSMGIRPELDRPSA